MAHNINIVNGKAAMMSVLKTPWHGLGTVVEDYLSSKEVIKVAGLDYEVVLVPAGGKINGEWKEVPGRMATMREDTKDLFGIVSNRYRIIQNRDAFEFTDTLLKEGEILYETAGALGKGERMWIAAKLPGDLRIGNTDDSIEKYVIFTNSHNGRGAAEVFISPVRPVCQNTLSFALNSKEAGFKIRHVGNVKDKVSAAMEALGLINKKYDDFAELMGALTEIKLKREDLERYFKTVTLSEGEKQGKEPSKRIIKTRERLVELYETQPGIDLKGVKDTAWAALNAVTHWASHERTVHGGSLEDRFRSNIFGSAAGLKQRAVSEALALAR